MSPRDLHAHHRQTEWRLVVGFILLLLTVGGGLILWNYGWGGLLGGIGGVVGCGAGLLFVGGLLWFLLDVAGRWANRE